MKSRQEKTDNIKEILVRLALILVIIDIIAASVVYIKQLNTKTLISNEFYQYIGEVKQEYVGELELTKEGEITRLTSLNIDIQLDSTPVYYKNENRAIFPENMEIVFPNASTSAYRIPRFSSVFLEDEVAYVEVNRVEIPVQNSFIYDGNNLYFFLEKTIISIDDKEYELPAMSYVSVEYNDEIEIYNKESDECIIEDISGKEVRAEGSKYSIDLNVDSMEFDGKEQLLFKKIDKLKVFEASY